MSPIIRFPLSTELLRRLPRHPDWKYELIEGEAWLSPRPRPLTLIRATDAAVPSAGCDGVEILMLDGDSPVPVAIVELLIDVWANEDPYRSMSDPKEQLRAEIERSSKTAGLWVLAGDGQRVCAAAFVSTSEVDTPMLTWLSVRRDARERGLATELLRLVVHTLRERDVRHLESATSAANVASLHWHLSRGFQLAQDPLREALRAARRSGSAQISSPGIGSIGSGP